MTLQAAAVGNDPSAFLQTKQWAGGGVDGVTIFIGQASWADFDGCIGWEIGLWKNTAATKLWSIPLFPTGGDLTAAASGSYDSHYLAAAQQLAAATPTGPIYIRPGWEFNGSWEPWSAIGQSDQYIGAFRDFVSAFRSVSSRFVFTWNPNVGDQGMDPATAYPGDNYVDIIGSDFYWNTQWDSKDPTAAWVAMVTQKYGLAWLESFAAAHGKPTAYPEWGVMTDNAAPYIADVAAWIATHNVVYQGYWDSNDAYQGKLSGGALPDAAQAYLAAFDAPTIAGTHASVTTDQATDILFSGVTVGDLGAGATETASISFAAANGTLSGAGVAVIANGTATYTVSAASASALATTLQDIGFTAVAAPGVSATTTAVTLSLSNGTTASTLDTGTVVTAAHSTLQVDRDLNGDAKSDLLWRNTSGEVVTWSYSSDAGSLTFTDLGVVSKDWVISGIGDFNGDGKVDMLWRNANGEVATWLSTSGSSALISIDHGNVSNDWLIAGTGDFNGDGKSDVLWRNTNGEVLTWNPSPGSDVLTGTDLGNVSTDWIIAGTGDFNADGKTDVLWRNVNGDVVTWLSSPGSAALSAVDLGVVGGDWKIAGTGDFNGDGKADILWRNVDGEVVTWISKPGPNAFVAVDLGNVGASWMVVGTGDFNGDGISDVVWRNSTTGEIGAWESSQVSGQFSYVSFGAAGLDWQAYVSHN